MNDFVCGNYHLGLVKGVDQVEDFDQVEGLR